MRSLGAADLIVLFVFVMLVFDSRRFQALARSAGWGRRECISGHGLPAGANPDQVGISLRQIQMRNHVDWQDGGVGWEGPEVLPVDEPDDAPLDESDGAPLDADPTPEADSGPALPVLWKPFPALPAAGAAGDWAQAVTSALNAGRSDARPCRDGAVGTRR